MSDATDTAATQQAPESDAQVRSTQGVLLVLGAILVIPIVALVVAFAPRGGSGAGADLVDSVDTGDVQAVYLTNDLVYFGIVDDSHGDFFVLKDAFYLRTTGSADSRDDDQSSQLVPVPVSEEVGGDGDLRVNANEVVRIQALTEDSEIAKAIDIGD